MEIQLKNIIKNKFLKDKVDIILKEKNDNKKAYIGCIALLEYINVKVLQEHFKIKLPDYDIARIMVEYLKVDGFLFDFMADVNSEYNIIDFENISDFDVKYFLYDIDLMYGYILDEYGDIVK